MAPQHVPDYPASIGILVTCENKIERMLLRIVPDESAAIVDPAILSHERDREEADSDVYARAQPEESPGGRGRSREASQHFKKPSMPPAGNKLSGR
jgi:hypothetical protein